MYLEFVVTILLFCAFAIMNMNDDLFLKEGQKRHWTGNIMDSDGEIDFWESLSEKFGFSGNPLFSY